MLPIREQGTKAISLSNPIIDNRQRISNPAIIEASASDVRGEFSSGSEHPWDKPTQPETVQMHTFIVSPSSLSSAGYTLLWPLWFAGFMDLTTKNVQAYCIKHLEKIGQNMGIQQAFILAKLVETKTEPEIWIQDK